MTGRERCSGFTLVEVAVALAIGGLVTLTAAATASSVADLASRTQAHLSAPLRAVAVRTQLRDWLRASHASADTVFDGSFRGFDGPEPGTDALQFAVVDPTPTTRGRASILIGIDRRADGRSALMAEIRPEREALQRLELVAGARSLEARYLYVVSSEPRWFSGWGSEVERPVAVRLFIDGPGLHPLLRLPITVWLRA